MKATPFALLLLLAMLLCPVAGLAAATRDYRKELRDAQSQQQRRRHRECIALCDKMLEYHKEAWQIQEITWVRIESLVQDSQYEGAQKALAALAAAYAEDKKLQTAVALRTGDVQRLLKKFDAAVATWRKVAAAVAETEPGQAAEALLRTGDVLCTELEKPLDGVAAYREVATKFATQLPKQAAEAIRRIATAHETHTKDMLKAAAAYQELTEKHPTSYDEGTLSGFYRKAVDCFVKAEKPAEAIAAAQKAEAALQSVSQKAAFGVRAGDLLLEQEKFAEARTQYQSILCAYPLEQSSCRHAQTRIVESYRAESRWDDALGAARILYDAAADEQGIRNAAQIVAQAFLAADADLVRANAFLAYQRFGPDGPDGKRGTEDDVAVNHLASVKYPARDAATDKQFQAAIDAWPRNYEGYRARGYLYIHWGKPKEGAGQFLQAFKAAELKQVPAAVQELVLVGIKAHTASFHGLDRVFEFVNHGPKGKSGKESLRDPFDGL